MSMFNRQGALFAMLFCLMMAAALRFPDLPQAPPGLHYDEAANAVLATEIGQGGERPIFITSYTGKEVLFFYLAGGLIHLIGSSVFALRLTSAFVGVLTVAVTYWLGLELFRDRRIALLAAALLAVSFWHLLFSRLGFRAITQPLLQAIVVAALLHGLRRDQWRWLLLAGVALGLAAYTYLAVRLFPVLLGIALLPVLLNGRCWQQRWRQMGVVLLVALFVAMPLLLYFWQHPDTFWVRITQVSPGSPGLTLSESVLKSLGMLFIQGDPYIRFNIPQRPLFDWFWGGLLLVGWGSLLWRWRQPVPDWQRSAHLLLILAPFVMLLPTALATNEIVPSNLRALGLIPFIFFLPALGLHILLDDLQRRFGRPDVTQALVATCFFVLMVGGIWAEQLYFEQWAVDPAVYEATDGDLSDVATFLDALDTEGKRIYIAAQHYQHPTLAYLSAKYEDVNWLPQSSAIVFPSDQPAIYIYPRSSHLPLWVNEHLETAVWLDTPLAQDGAPAFLAFTAAAPPPMLWREEVGANFGNAITLLGYDVGLSESGDTLPLTLYWRVQGQPDGNYAPFVHLEDAWGHRWSQVETFAYPAAQWQAGEWIVQRVEVPLPPGLPSAGYGLRIGLFDGSQRLPRLDENGRYAGNTVLLPNVQTRNNRIADDLPQAPHLVNEAVQPGLRLLGYERGAATAASGAPYGVALYWLATEPLTAMSELFELRAADGTVYPLASGQPNHNTYPFTDWIPPQFVIDRQSFTVPDDAPPGNYRLWLRFEDALDNQLAEINLGLLEIIPTNRLFMPPPINQPMEALFGNEVALLGYNLVAGDTPGTYRLELIWQAQQQPTADYTVFVHLLQPDGSCNPCAWQQDVQPQQGQYPTSRWLPGEVVVDSYEIVLPETAVPTTYPLEIGLYLAETGQRLQIATPDGSVTDALMLTPVQRP